MGRGEGTHTINRSKSQMCDTNRLHNAQCVKLCILGQKKEYKKCKLKTEQELSQAPLKQTPTCKDSNISKLSPFCKYCTAELFDFCRQNVKE